MDFILKTDLTNLKALNQRYITGFDPSAVVNNVLLIQKLPHLDYIDNEFNLRQWLIGDVIHHDANEVNCKGLYYEITFSTQSGVLEIKPDFSCFLPLYYAKVSGSNYISSSVDWLTQVISPLTPNPQFVTDTALYNAPLGEECFYQEIKRVEYGKHLVLSPDGLSIEGNKRVFDHFSSVPAGYRKSIDRAVQLFIENGTHYMQESCLISLTGGFDGRTVTAVAHGCKAQYETYSYGKAENDDVYIPQMLSRKLGFAYHHISLGDDFVNERHLPFVHDTLRYTGGTNGFLYPHAHYAAVLYQDLHKPLITGYCGSELLRNAHECGAITSQAFISLLAEGKDYALQQVMNNSDYLLLGEEYLQPAAIEAALDKVIAWLDKLPDHLSKNQQIAVFEFEEILPKIFGNWVYAGMHYARIRVPFVDPAFFTFLMGTRVSQVYRNFMEKNPFKRFYGQLLYSKIIDSAWSELGRLMSGKGYAPADLLSVSGRIRVTLGYLGKKKRNRRVSYDNLGLISGMVKYLKDTGNEFGVTDEQIARMHRNSHMRDLFMLRLSAREYLKLHNAVSTPTPLSAG